MEPKFKVGDVIRLRHVYGHGPISLYTVVELVYEMREVSGKWDSGWNSLIIGQSYVLHNKEWDRLHHMYFYEQEAFTLVSSSEYVCGPKAEWISFCPKGCSVELEDQYSEWAKAMVKKCPKCGYCN